MLIIRNGTLVNDDGALRADLAVDGGVICAIEPTLVPSPGDRTLDATGCYLFPGFIDGHTHFDMESALCTTADDFATGTLAALCGGTTCVVDFATQERGGTLQSALDAWHRKAEGKCSCHYGFHMAVTDWNERTRAELPAMIKQGVSSFKVYLAYDALRLPDRAIYELLCELRQLGGLLGAHCENGDLVDALVAREREAGRLSPAAHPVSRPPLVEKEAVSRLCAIARLAGCAVQVVHLSSDEGLAQVRRARARGQRVLAECCPQYLTLTDAVYRLPGFEGAKYVCSPPIRSEDDRRALLSATLDGEIDTLSTDHCSYRYADQKTLGRDDFSRIPNGLPGVEHRPALMYDLLCHENGLPVEKLCRLLSAQPARQYGLYPRKGALRVGSDADIVVWDGEKETTVTAATQHMAADYTPWEGRRVHGVARQVLLMGELASSEGSPVRTGLGRFVKRDPVAL